jgi:hypothetical protein
MPGMSNPALLIASEMVEAVAEHGAQVHTPMLEAEPMTPLNENGRTPSVPSI